MSTIPESSAEWDVVVVGGGPAGSTTATLLARAGVKTLLIDSNLFPRYHIGESLIPATYRVFDALGFLPKLKASTFPEKHSVRFVSRDGKESHPFYFSEVLPPDQARTWQVERSLFDQMLLNHAREQGVTVWEESHVDQVLFDGDRARGVVAIRNREHRVEVPAQVVVDASGRGCLIGRQLSLRNTLPDLRKASVWTYYEGAERLPGKDAGETTIFLLPGGGWFWYIPLPNDVVSVGVVAPSSVLFDPSRHHEMTFHDTLDRCHALVKRLESAKMVGRILGMNQLAYANSRTSGDGWVMIGDARAFLDPIYSSGLCLALASGEMASRTIKQGLDSGDVSARVLGSFEPGYNAGVEVMRRLIHAFYDPEFSFPQFLQRFPTLRDSLIGCLIGDVFGDMRPFLAALAQMTPPPAPVLSGTEALV